MSETHARRSTRYLWTFRIAGWGVVLLFAFYMGRIGGNAAAYGRYEVMWLVLIAVTAATVQGSFVAAKIMGKRISRLALLFISAVLLLALVVLALDMHDPIMGVACLFLPGATVSMGWASGLSSTYAYEDELNAFERQMSLEQAQQKLLEDEHSELLKAAEDMKYMSNGSRKNYEHTVVDAVLNLTDASSDNSVSLAMVAKVSGCPVARARIILKRFESEGHIQISYGKDRKLWEDQIIMVRGTGLRKYVMSKEERKSSDSGSPDVSFVIHGNVSSQNFGYNTVNSRQTQNNGLDAKDIIRLRKELFEHLDPSIGADIQRKIQGELDDLDNPHRIVGAIENLGKIFEGLGKIGEPLTKILEPFQHLTWNN